MRTRRNQNTHKPSTHSVAHRQPVTSHDRLVASTLAGMALLAASPASHALSMGELTVHSSLGQQLNASVPVQLAAGESLANGCIQSTRSGNNELGRVPDAVVSTPEAARPGTYTLRITSATSLYEPIYALSLRASCPGTAAIARQYVLMLDLPGMTPGQASVPSQPPLTQSEQMPEALPASTASGDVLRTAPARERPLRARRKLDAASTPILPGTRYQVVAGDTLSSIAARVDDRKVTLWVLANRIFVANPAAFIRNDLNLIKLGSTIDIPAVDFTSDAVTAAALPPPLPEPIPVPLPEPVRAPAIATAPVEPQVAIATTAVPAEPVVAPPTQSLAITTPVARPAVEASTPGEAAASPLLAAAAGAVFGLLISGLLWFRRSLPGIGRKQSAKQVAKPATTAEKSAVSPMAIPRPITVRSERAEPSITVQWSARPEDALAAEFATQATPAPQSQASPSHASSGNSEEITSELEKLFGDDSETMRSASLALPAQMDETPDSVDDDQQAETLLQALSLLERDYETELTASQVLDLSAMREALATGTDSMPVIRKPDQ